jgi:hypothetical protein
MQANSYNVFDAVALLPPWAQGRPRSPFTFPVDFITGGGFAIPANASVSQDVKVSDDADFALVFQSAVLTNDAAQSVFVNLIPVTVSIVDGGSGRLYMSAPVHLGNQFGAIAADGPYVLPQPAILVRSSTITITLTNLTATATFSARLALQGFKMYGGAIPMNPMGA